MTDIENGEAGFISSLGHLRIGQSVRAIQLIEYNPNAYKDTLYRLYKLQAPVTLATWLPKRRAQFLAGRLAAKYALNSSESLSKRSLGETTQELSIGKHREPIWPRNLTGSISHSHQLSIATVKHQATDRSGIGLDIQSLIDQKMQHEIASTILTQSDSALMKQSVSGLSESMLFTLIFSAKESFFKAFFSTAGNYFGFDAVSVTEVDIDSSELTLKTTSNLASHIPLGFEVKVAFTTLNEPDTQIITLCDWEL